MGHVLYGWVSALSSALFLQKTMDATCPPDDKTGELLVEIVKPLAAKEPCFCQELGETFLTLRYGTNFAQDSKAGKQHCTELSEDWAQGVESL